MAQMTREKLTLCRVASGHLTVFHRREVWMDMPGLIRVVAKIMVPILVYPKYMGPYYYRDPKRDHNVDIHPFGCESTGAFIRFLSSPHRLL